MCLSGIDTVSGYIKGLVSKNDMTEDITENITTCTYIAESDKTRLIINPNIVNGQEKLITKYSDFKERMEFIFSNMGKTYNDFEPYRVDFCFNSTDLNSYKAYYKAHRLLILCLAKAYTYHNTYSTKDLWTYKDLSVAIKNDTSEIENYNKCLESQGKDVCKNRLEIRSKRTTGSSIYIELFKWFERFDKALSKFDDVQKKCNNHLIKLYNDDLKKEPLERDYLSLEAFLLQYKGSIYTRKQMIELIRSLDSSINPENKADKFKEKHNIEYFFQEDLDFIVQTLKGKITTYLES